MNLERTEKNEQIEKKLTDKAYIQCYSKEFKILEPLEVYFEICNKLQKEVEWFRVQV